MKIGIIGAGMVGGTTANALALTGVSNDIVLVDKNEALANAQAEDISLATPYVGDSTVRSGSFEDLSGADVCVVTAGVAQRPGETRAEWVKGNIDIYQEMLPQIIRNAPNAILIIATNPVDPMTQVARKMADYPAERVIGTGTILSTMRFRVLLGQYFSAPINSVHAYVLGEQGDSQVLCWAGAEIGHIPLADYADDSDVSLSRQLVHDIDETVRRSDYRIIEGKGAAHFGIAGGICRIIQAISSGNDEALTISMVTENAMGIGPAAISLPRLIGSKGIIRTTEPILSENERRALRRSVGITLEALPSDWSG